MSRRTGLLATTYTVTVHGEPAARVQLSVGGHAWKKVTLDGSGSQTVTATSVDLIGLLGDTAKALGSADVTASYV